MRDDICIPIPTRAATMGAKSIILAYDDPIELERAKIILEAKEKLPPVEMLAGLQMPEL